MKALRVTLVAAIVIAMLGLAAPAYATDCSDNPKDCRACEFNDEFSLRDPRPIVCYF